MANFNLTTQEIKDTYEQLAQVSASLLVDGTGSLSPIVTSSIINFPTEVSRSAAAAGFGAGGGGVSEATFTTYTASNDSKVNSLTSATSSYALKTEISGAFTSTSASIAVDIATNTSNIGTLTSATSSYAIKTEISGAFTSTSASLAANIATNTINIGTLTSATSSYAVVSSNNTFSGTQNFLNIAVSGTASFAYVEQITGSAVIIGEEFIILNASTPTARYAGIKIYDTGSTNATASLEWDGVQDTWILMEESGDTAVILTGMTGSRGSEALPSLNTIQKGGGFNQLTDSNITDDGTKVTFSTQITASGGIDCAGDLTLSLAASKLRLLDAGSYIQANNITGSWGQTNPGVGVALLINGNISASSYFGDGSNLTGVSSGLVAGTGTDSLRSALTSTPATASGPLAIALGNEARALGTGSVVIGSNARSFADNAVMIGTNTQNYDDSRINSVAIGNNASTAQETVAIGHNATGLCDSAVIIGRDALGNANFNVTIGYGANCSDGGLSFEKSIAIGFDAKVSTQEGINIGNRFFFNSGSNDSIELRANSIVSGSLNVGGNTIITGSITSSVGFSGDGSGLTNITTTSASFASTASSADNFLVRNILELSGSVSSEVTNLTIASSTASVDLSTSNFFEKSLTAATFIANPTNAKPGSTYTFKFDSGSLITNFDTDYRFVDGTNPTLSNGQDIVTFVSFLSGSAVKLYGTGLANFS